MKGEDEEENGGGRKRKQKGGVNQAKEQQDYNEFLNDIEEDPEMRQNIMLFKVSLTCWPTHMLRMMM